MNHRKLGHKRTGCWKRTLFRRWSKIWLWLWSRLLSYPRLWTCMGTFGSFASGQQECRYNWWPGSTLPGTHRSKAGKARCRHWVPLALCSTAGWTQLWFCWGRAGDQQRPRLGRSKEEWRRKARVGETALLLLLNPVNIIIFSPLTDFYGPFVNMHPWH